MKNNRPTTLLLLLAIFLIGACKMFQPVEQPNDTVDKPDEPTPIETGTAQFDYWIHSPLHPGNNKAVTFKAKVKEPRGIVTIDLHVYEYELYLNADNLPSRKKRANGQWGKVKTWVGNDQTAMTLEHRYIDGFPKASQIEYVFKVTDKKGKVTERVAFFDAGTSLWPQDKILLYSATRAPLSQTFNLCFFPDVDFKSNWSSFLDDSRKLIFDGFHQSNIIQDKKERWSFYYTKQEADGLKIAQEFDNPAHYPDFMKNEMITGIDAFALLHKEPYSDGSYMYGNIHFLSQSVFTTESYNYGTAIHEMGHSVFQLSDEYNGCACFQPKEGFSNVFETEKACLDFQKQQGLANQHCHRIYSYNQKSWYTPEKNVYFPSQQACMDFNKEKGYTEANCITFIDVDGKRTYRSEEGLCIMNDDGDTKIYPFQEACLSVVNDYYQRFGDVLLSFGGAPQTVQENIFNYEPVVYLTMKERGGEWTAEVDKIDYGIPVKKNKKGNGASISFLDNNNNTTYKLQIDRPGEGHFCGGNTNFRHKTSEVSTCMITVPYAKNMKELVVANRLVKSGQRIKGNVTKQRIDLSADLKKAAALFENR